MRSLKKYLLFFTVLLATSSFGQSPDGFNYQGMVRDDLGEILGNQNISIRLVLRSGSAVGTVVYTEEHSVVTSFSGLFNVVVGEGSSLDDFGAIDWSSQRIWVQTDVDFSGGGNYEFLSAVQMLSVPYALYAENSGNSIWTKDNDTISYNEGFVGIGTSSPDALLTVKVDVDNFLEANVIKLRNEDTSPRSSIGVQLSASDNKETYGSLNFYGGTFANPSNYSNMFAMNTNGSGLILNNWGDNATTRFLFTQGNTDYVEAMRVTADLKVGIQTSDPQSPLEVNGLIHSSSNGFKFPDGSIQTTASTTNAWGINVADIYYNAGSVGIGTTTPATSLHVSSGDIYLDDAANGVIMTSPNGSCFRMTVSDVGAPVFTSVTCP